MTLQSDFRTSFGPLCAVKDDILRHWTIARRWILPAVEFTQGGFTEDYVVRKLLNEEWFLIYGANCAVIWEDPGFKTTKTFHCVLCGGDFKEIAEASRVLFALAKSNGFQQVYVSGRRGWAKILPGFKEYCTTYTMEL